MSSKFGQMQPLVSMATDGVIVGKMATDRVIVGITASSHFLECF